MAKRKRRNVALNVAAILWSAVLAFWGMTCLGCLDALGPSDWRVVGATAIDPPAWFRTAHQDVQECLGVERPFDPIRWFAVDTILVEAEDRWRSLGGLWLAPRTIYLRRGQYENDLGFLVRHELIHYVLQEGHRPATDSLFTVCSRPPGYSCRELEGGVVACGWNPNREHEGG